MTHAAIEVNDTLHNREKEGIYIGEFISDEGWYTEITLSQAYRLDGIKLVDVLSPDLATLIVSTRNLISKTGSFEQYIQDNYTDIGGRSITISEIILFSPSDSHISAGITLNSQHDAELFVNQTDAVISDYMKISPTIIKSAM